MTWTVTRPGLEDFILTLDARPVQADGYLALPLEPAGSDRYTAKLTVSDVTLQSGFFNHTLRVSNREKDTGEIFSSRETR